MGAGVIAQVMHLHYLRELRDRYELVALCDLSPTVVQRVGERYDVPRRCTDWPALLDMGLDALFVLTPGSHAPIAAAAAEAGLHVFVEKPLCLSADEGRDLLAAVERAGVRLMVGYMKRFDPAYRRLRAELARTHAVRAAAVTTLEAPPAGYLAHYPLVAARDVPPETLASLAADDDARVGRALGTDDPLLRRSYRVVLLDSAVHELNLLRSLLGEPDRVEFAAVRDAGLMTVLTFGPVQATLNWVDLPGIARYEQRFAFYAPDRRVSLSFPSPYLRSAPGELVVEGGAPGRTSSWRTAETASYEEAFELELEAFHALVCDDVEVPTTGSDALRDVELCAAIIRAAAGRSTAGSRPDAPSAAHTRL